MTSAPETCSGSLSIESFSYSWLINLQTSEIGDSFRAALDPSNRTSFIEMDPRMPPSKRWFLQHQHSHDFDFDFDLSFSQQFPDPIVHADELFSNGFLMPLFDSTKTDSSSLPNTPFHSQTSRKTFSDSKLRCSSLKRCKSLSKEILQRYLDFLRPVYQKMMRARLLNSKGRAAGLTSSIKKRKHILSSPGRSPRASDGSSSCGDWRRSSESEGSIHEAVLHCKRSIGK